MYDDHSFITIAKSNKMIPAENLKIQGQRSQIKGLAIGVSESCNYVAFEGIVVFTNPGLWCMRDDGLLFNVSKTFQSQYETLLPDDVAVCLEKAFSVDGPKWYQAMLELQESVIAGCKLEQIYGYGWKLTQNGERIHFCDLYPEWTMNRNNTTLFQGAQLHNLFAGKRMYDVMTDSKLQEACYIYNEWFSNDGDSVGVSTWDEVNEITLTRRRDRQRIIER